MSEYKSKTEQEKALLTIEKQEAKDKLARVVAEKSSSEKKDGEKEEKEVVVCVCFGSHRRPLCNNMWLFSLKIRRRRNNNSVFYLSNTLKVYYVFSCHCCKNIVNI